MPLPQFGDSEDQAPVSRIIRNYCGWHIWPRITEALVLDGPGTPVLVVPTRWLVAVTACTETMPGAGQSATVVDPDDLELSTRKGLVRHVSRRCWTSRGNGVAITVTHGYDELPEDLELLATNVTARWAQNPRGLRRIQVGQRSEDYAADVLFWSELAVLDAYRRVA